MENSILLVDDNPGILKSYGGSITDEIEDVRLFFANNENEAIRHINNQQQSFDVIVTDLMMNEPTGGIRVLNEAKKKDPLTLVIIITAFPNKLDRQGAFKLGAFDCLVKSTAGVKTVDELIYKIKNAIFARNSFKELLQSKERIDSFEKYFDPSVFEKIRNNPDLLAPKNRTVTLVFWDLRGFSSFSEKLKTNTDIVAGFLRDFYEVSSKVIFNNKGVLDKFIGDGVFALFGAFNENEAEVSLFADAALNAALELRKEFRTVYKKWEQKWRLVAAETIEFGLACGIHTGEAIIGNLGTEWREQFTAIGAHVNLASRIENTAKIGEIRVSSTTRYRATDSFNFKKIDTLSNIKNIHGTFNIFELDESSNELID